MAGILTKEKKRLRVLNKNSELCRKEKNRNLLCRVSISICVQYVPTTLLDHSRIYKCKKKIAKGAMVPNTSHYDIKIHRVANQDQDLGANTERRNHGYWSRPNFSNKQAFVLQCTSLDSQFYTLSHWPVDTGVNYIHEGVISKKLPYWLRTSLLVILVQWTAIFELQI